MSKSQECILERAIRDYIILCGLKRWIYQQPDRHLSTVDSEFVVLRNVHGEIYRRPVKAADHTEPEPPA